MPSEVFDFKNGSKTSFSEKHNKINIKGDMFPDEDYSTENRDRMSVKAVIAHKYYGHYQNHPSEFEANDWRDEFKASYDAAIRTANLSDDERRSLMIDAKERAQEAGVSIKLNEIMRRIIYGY